MILQGPRHVLRSPEGRRRTTYAILRMTLTVKSPISRDKAEYEGCATWSIPRGVSSHHVLSRAFGDAYCKRE